MQLDSVISISALITIAGAVVKLAFQSGTTIQTLKELSSRVEALAERFEAYTVEAAALKTEMVRWELRIVSLERWRERAEAREPRR